MTYTALEIGASSCTKIRRLSDDCRNHGYELKEACAVSDPAE